MNNRGRGKITVFALVLLAVFSLYSGEIPEEIKRIVGEYQGQWEMFGLDEKGEIVKKMSWTDTMVAKNPVVKNGRAYVTTVDTMTFPGQPNASKMEGSEGYLLKEDGTLGDYFFEAHNQVTRMKELEEDVWVYTLPAQPREMAMLGFTNCSFARHVMVKVVTRENGVETHRISRLTTVTWKDSEGRENSRQFVSLKGFHKRKQ